mmetsp:Transcript_23093/g.54015  ORF Transcript_23093/g.54015 Transcript_23093/m.54015 type:complete len:287 (+) Transcript_23093:49-909(+)
MATQVEALTPTTHGNKDKDFDFLSSVTTVLHEGSFGPSAHGRSGMERQHPLDRDFVMIDAAFSQTPAIRKRPRDAGYGCSFLSMTEDAIDRVLWLLSVEELGRVLSVCKTLHDSGSREEVWRRLCHWNFATDINYFQGPNRLFVSRLPVWKGMYRVLKTMEIELEFQDGPNRGLIFPVSKSGCKIGRSRNSEVPIVLDEMVSRRHCMVIFRWRFGIFDIGGINGTYVNGYCLPQQVEVPLHLGDVVDLGVSRFIVRPRLTAAPTEAIMGVPVPSIEPCKDQECMSS